jgi:hypothetical protein
MLKTFFQSLFAVPIADPSELRRFLSGEASLLAQRTTYEFSRNTLAWYGQHYFADAGFNEAFRKCRWDSFGLLASDMTLLTFGRLSEFLPGSRDQVAVRMPELYAEILREYPLPAHRPGGWTDMADRFAHGLGGLSLPVNPAKLATTTAKAMFATMPVFSENRAGDYDVVYNAVHFGLVAFSDRLRRRVSAKSAAAALAAGQPLDRERAVPVS